LAKPEKAKGQVIVLPPAKKRCKIGGWPADNVERWPIGKLTPYARNARTHSPEQVTQIAQAITEFGWTNPVLVDEKGIMIAGHGRVLAAKLLGLKEVPVMIASGWTDAQKRTYVIADNQLTLNGDWDKSLLKLEVADLEFMGVDLKTLGFSTKELNDLRGVPKGDGDASAQLGEGLSYSIVVRCTDEIHQGELLETLEGQGLKCEALIS
jgi:ParB-like chromosome segregation protein Spo0J